MSDTTFLTFWHLSEETGEAPKPQKVLFIVIQYNMKHVLVYVF